MDFYQVVEESRKRRLGRSRSRFRFWLILFIVGILLLLFLFFWDRGEPTMFSLHLFHAEEDPALIFYQEDSKETAKFYRSIQELLKEGDEETEVPQDIDSLSFHIFFTGHEEIERYRLWPDRIIYPEGEVSLNAEELFRLCISLITSSRSMMQQLKQAEEVIVSYDEEADKILQAPVQDQVFAYVGEATFLRRDVEAKKPVEDCFSLQFPAGTLYVGREKMIFSWQENWYYEANEALFNILKNWYVNG